MAKVQAQTKAPAAAQAAPEAVKRGRTVEISDQLRADYDSFAGQTKSATIRGLHAKGYSRGQIAKVMGIIYQHVRNVLITPVKRVSEEADTSSK